jgi:hypothetical protein
VLPSSTERGLHVRRRIPKDTERSTTALVVMIPVFILTLALILGLMGRTIW